VKCLAFAYSEIGVESIQTLLDLGETVCGVITHRDHPNEARWFRSVEELAVRQGIAVIMPDDPNTPDVLAWARDRQPDIVFSFYYRKMLGQPLLELGRLGAYNMHGSLLPKFRGRAPVNWAIIEGATETGLTLHEMIKSPDAGDIVAQEGVVIGPDENAREVFDKLVPVARRLLTRVVPLLREGRAPRRAQNPAEARYFGARTPADGIIDWSQPAKRIHNLVRALTRPYPGAFTYVNGRKLFIWKGADRSIAAPRGKPGEVISAGDQGVDVATGSGVYTIGDVGFDAASTQKAADVLKAGNRLGLEEAVSQRRI